MTVADARRRRKPQQHPGPISGKDSCTGCRQRKTNCDKERPTCFPCLIFGTDCCYGSAISGTTPLEPGKASRVDVTQPRLPGLRLRASDDPFDALSVDMTHRSSEVLYHFIKNRAMLARAIQKDEKQFNASLGLGQTDRTWFQVAICLTASHRGLHGPEFQKTFLHHRQQLLLWMRDSLVKYEGPVPAGYLSILISMMQADSAAGHNDSVQAHLLGFFSILDSRRRSMKGWLFYDGLAKRYTLMALSFVSMIRQSHWPGNPASLDSILGSMYTQLANEFLRVFVLTGNPKAAPRTDGPILVWLCRALQEVRLLKSNGLIPSQAPARLAGLEYREGMLWLKATSAYALTVGTMDWFEPDDADAPSRSDALLRLKSWSHQLIDSWMLSAKGMTSSIANEIWRKITWLETDDGLELVREIAMLAQYDGPCRAKLEDAPTRAPALIYV